jgi:hypothetical protein
VCLGFTIETKRVWLCLSVILACELCDVSVSQKELFEPPKKKSFLVTWKKVRFWID